MKVYYVERYGVYPQGIYGIFSTFDLAMKAISEAKSKEHDNYHGFCINSRDVDVCGYEDVESTTIYERRS